MPDRTDTTLLDKLKQRLQFYDDLGLGPFFKDRELSKKQVAFALIEHSATTTVAIEEPILPKAAAKVSELQIASDSLLKIRLDLGECTRCKLHSTRHQTVSGGGTATANLVLVTDGPRSDQDQQR